MTNKSTTVSFRNPSDSLVDKYWIRLEQVEIKETVTLGEAADLVDTIFDIDPCVEPEEDANDEVETEPIPDNPDEEITEETIESVFAPELPMERDVFNDAIKTWLPMDMCQHDGKGNWITQVKVILSTPGDLYTLRLTNGEILGTVTTDEEINTHIEVDDKSGIALDYPVVGGDSFEWGNSSTSAPLIIRTGNVLNWGEKITGSIIAKYLTRYDLVDILVYGSEEGDLGECEVIGFYHGLVDEVNLKIPEDEGDDVDRADYCGVRTHWEFPPDTPGLPQWVTFETMFYCKCSGEYDHSKYTHEPTAADMAKDPPTHIFPGITKVEDGGFVDCGEKDFDLSDPELYELICCHPPDINLPDCVTVHKKAGGEKLDPDVQKGLIEQYGDRLQISYLMPDDGDCGTDTYHQKKFYRDCCEEVIPMEWNDDNSIETIGPNSSGWVMASGGKPPYVWIVLGEGFFFPGGLKQITTQVPSTIIYTIDACGPGFITVTDVCDQYAQGTVRSTNGEWVYQGEGPDAAMNVVCGRGWWFPGGIPFRYEYIEGHRKTDQSYTHRAWIAPPTYVWGNYCGICNGQVNCPELDPVDRKCTRCVTGAGLDHFPYPCGNDDNYSDVPCRWDTPVTPDVWVDMYDIQPGGVNVHVWECPE